jgi:hypothetical protein
MSLRLFPTFSSLRFSVSGFMLRFLIYLDLDLSFVQGDKYGSIFILLHTDSQLDQRFLFFFFFFIVYFWDLCQRSNDCKCVVLFLGFQFYSIVQHFCLCTNTMQFFFFNYYCSIVKLGVKDGGSSSSSFIVKNHFRYSGFSAFPDEFENCSFHVFEEL